MPATNPTMHRDGDVDVGQLVGAEAVEEERVPGGLARHRSRDCQEQVGKERQRPAEFPGGQSEGALDERLHGIRRPRVYRTLNPSVHMVENPSAHTPAVCAEVGRISEPANCVTRVN